MHCSISHGNFKLRHYRGPVSDHGAPCRRIESITLDRSTVNWYAGHSMSPEFWAIIGVGVVVLGSHLRLHRDIASLRERMAKLEGTVEAIRERMA